MTYLWKYLLLFIHGIGLVLMIMTVIKIGKLRKTLNHLEGEILTEDMATRILHISRLGIAGTLLGAIPALIRIFI